MYVYHLPFEINKELCRLLDNDDDWKELAGVHMKYSPFDVIEIEKTAQRQVASPTSVLFTRWGQLNHKVEELFMLLYRMKYIPACRCLVPVLDTRFGKLLRKFESNSLNRKSTAAVDDNANNQKFQRVDRSESSIPLPVMLIEKGVQLPTSSQVINGNSPTDNSSTNTSKNTSRSHDVKSSERNEELLRNVSAIPKLSFEDLRVATDDWSEANLLGRGGFGQVFKGEWKLLPVAVKRLRDNDGRDRELIREMCLNQYRHDNILPLYGYSLGGPEACIVYQLMMGGSLEQRLRGKTSHAPLSWCQRLQIAQGVARGLQYLHTMAGTPLIHGDIKPANILLDQCTIPKIGDFGLARKGPYGEDRTHLKVSRVHGTRPYLPDEYLRSRCLSPAVDVFSFGVVLLEMASALPAMDRARPAPLLSDFVRALALSQADLGSLQDRALAESPASRPELCRAFVGEGLLCTRLERHERPSMLQVFRRLDALSPT